MDPINAKLQEEIKVQEQKSPEMIDQIPVVTQLADIYLDTNGSLKEVHERRYLNCIKRFEQIYEQKPEFFIRAPGRANIIGEHIDYCGYSVLPFALEQDFLIAYAKSPKDELRINNIDMALFPEEILETDPYQKMREETSWINYFLAGYKAVMTSKESEAAIKAGQKPTGMKIFIDSVVPMEAGVSSSAAFVVSSATLALHANNLVDSIDKNKLAKYVIEGEKLVGTATGGMDQTISIMAEMGQAKYIEFNPKIACHSTPIPEGYTFVIANSLTPSSKVATLTTRYNKRVVECRIATILLAMAFDNEHDITSSKSCPYKTLYELQHANGWDNDTVLDHINSKLKKGGYSKSDLEEALNSNSIVGDLNDIEHIYEVWQNNVRFHIFERAYHVLNEVKRVEQFRAICLEQSVSNEEKGEKLGQLMNESYESLKTYYECSSIELDELTQLCRESGAIGSRVTGAGWGGC